MKQKHYAFVDHFFEQVVMLNSFIAVKIVEYLFQNYHKYYKLIQKMQTICFSRKASTHTNSFSCTRYFS